MDVAAGLVGVLAGLLASPVLDRVATNAPLRRKLWASTPRSKRLVPLALAASALAGLCGLVFGLTLEALAGALFCWILVIVTRTDLEHRLIPNVVVLPGTVLMLGLRTIDDPSIEWALAALVAGGALFLIVLVYPSGMGMGDVKLAAFIGAGLGIDAVVAMFIGFFAAFVPAVVLLARHGRSARKRMIPLGPFLALGGVVALFAGDAILDWYTGIGT